MCVSVFITKLFKILLNGEKTKINLKVEKSSIKGFY